MQEFMTLWAPKMVMLITFLQAISFIGYLLAKDYAHALYWFAAVLITASTLMMKG